jgi:hypothetical protein
VVTSSAELQGGTLDEFSGQLETLLERPVINKTGITGRFDIHIEFSREGTKLAAFPLIQPNGGLSAPSALQAVRRYSLSFRISSASDSNRARGRSKCLLSITWRGRLRIESFLLASHIDCVRAGILKTIFFAFSAAV